MLDSFDFLASEQNAYLADHAQRGDRMTHLRSNTTALSK